MSQPQEASQLSESNAPSDPEKPLNPEILNRLNANEFAWLEILDRVSLHELIHVWRLESIESLHWSMLQRSALKRRRTLTLLVGNNMFGFAYGLMIQTTLFHAMQDYIVNDDGTRFAPGHMSREYQHHRIDFLHVDQQVYNLLSQDLCNVEQINLVLNLRSIHNDEELANTERFVAQYVGEQLLKGKLKKLQMWIRATDQEGRLRFIDRLNEQIAGQQLKLKLTQLWMDICVNRPNGENIPDEPSIDFDQLLGIPTLTEFRIYSSWLNPWNAIQANIGHLKTIASYSFTEHRYFRENWLTGQLRPHCAKFEALGIFDPTSESDLPSLMPPFMNLTSLLLNFGAQERVFRNARELALVNPDGQGPPPIQPRPPLTFTELLSRLNPLTRLVTLRINVPANHTLLTDGELGAGQGHRVAPPPPLASVKALEIWKTDPINHREVRVDSIRPLFPNLQIFKMQFTIARCNECRRLGLAHNLEQCRRMLVDPLLDIVSLRMAVFYYSRMMGQNHPELFYYQAEEMRNSRVAPQPLH